MNDSVSHSCISEGTEAVLDHFIVEFVSLVFMFSILKSSYGMAAGVQSKRLRETVDGTYPTAKPDLRGFLPNTFSFT